jgi:hypothetical protein
MSSVLTLHAKSVERKYNVNAVFSAIPAQPVIFAKVVVPLTADVTRYFQKTMVYTF